MGGDKMEGRGWFWPARHVRLAHMARCSGSSAAGFEV